MADLKGKVKLAASVNYSDIKDIYPLIKDTLDKIRIKIDKHTSSKEAKFLFDQIDVSRELYNLKYAKAALILENSLNAHARDIYDSLYCYGRLKEIFIKLSNLNKAIEANMTYDKLAKRTNDPKYLNGIIKKSKICDIFGLNKQAVLEKRKEFAEEIKNKQHDTDFIASYYNDQGVYFNRQKISDSALFYFTIADSLITKKLAYTSNATHYQFFKSLIEGNMALAYANNGDHKKAISFLKNDIYYSKKVNDIESAFNSYILISKCNIVLNDIKLAQKYADSAEVISNMLNQPRVKLKLLFLQAELLDKKGLSANAIARFKEYMSLKDSISTNEKEMQLINQQVALDIQNKDLEILEKNRLIQNSKIYDEKQKAFRAYLMAGLVVLIVLIVFLFYANSNSKKREFELSQKNERIQQQNKQIETSLKEKETLLREIHHRVKNNLQIISSVINLQADKISDEKLKEVLSELKLRISSIALTHQMLYHKESVNSVSLQEYLQNLVKQIVDSYEGYNVKVNLKISKDNSVINIDSAIPLGLLVNEILTNSFKHAFVGRPDAKIELEVNTSGKKVELTIKDNGIGLPENYMERMNKPTSLGFELIAILVDQLNAKLEINSKAGTEFKVTFFI